MYSPKYIQIYFNSPNKLLPSKLNSWSNLQMCLLLPIQPNQLSLCFDSLQQFISVFQ